MTTRHGDTIYILPGGGAVPTPTSAAKSRLLPPPAGDYATAAAPVLEILRGGIKAGRILACAQAPTFSVPALEELAKVMLDKPGLRDPAQPLAPLEPAQLDSTSVPAGYTYLGQFINHDLTFNPTREKPPGEYDDTEIEQAQHPSFDLGCVYGAAPHKPSYERLYKNTFPAMRVGATRATLGVDPAVDTNFPSSNDLPREGGHASNPRKAIIADERNDDNLPVAQTHVAFLRFHNKVVELLKGKTPGLSDDQLFEAARKEVILCYQRIVLHDYLPKIVMQAAYQDVLSNPLRFFKVVPAGETFLPLEFTAAAFRAGHSMVRNTYSWNRIFRPRDPQVAGVDVAQLFQLFKFTGGGDMGLFDALPTTWVIDWRRFYDFSGLVAGPLPPLNMSRKLDTRLAIFLSRMPRLKDGKEERANLAFLDLLAGNTFQLPSGQEAARLLGVQAPLTDAEIGGGTDGDVLRDYGLDKQTPLWYYLLKEAELRGGGERLGPAGSRIVAETVYGLILWSQPYSILRGDESVPELAGVSSMAHLLHVGLGRDINPLG